MPYICSAVGNLRLGILLAVPMIPKHKFLLLGHAVTGTEKSISAAATALLLLLNYCSLLWHPGLQCYILNCHKLIILIARRSRVLHQAALGE